MSSPYLNIILTKINKLDAALRVYYQKIVDDIDKLQSFANKQNIALIILANSLDNLPEILPENIPEKTFLSHMAKYIYDKRDYISQNFYSEGYIVNSYQINRELAEGFTARIATDILEQYAAGNLAVKEVKIYKFSWQDIDNTDFPYEDLSEDPPEKDDENVTIEIIDGEFKIIDDK